MKPGKQVWRRPAATIFRVKEHPSFKNEDGNNIPQKHGCPVNFDKSSQMLSWAGLWAAHINIISAIPNL